MLIPLKLKQSAYSLIMFFRTKKKLSAPSTSSLASVSIYDINLTDIDGKTVSLAAFKGRKILIVNVATNCAYTPQYTQLEELYEKYIDKLVVLGFPSNDFKQQEPGSNEEIKSFCSNQYHVKFPIFAKSKVTGPGANPLYRWLTDETQNGWNNKMPQWNFCKYLIDENGALLNYFSESVNPFDTDITGKL